MTHDLQIFNHSVKAIGDNTRAFEVHQDLLGEIQFVLQEYIVVQGIPEKYTDKVN